MTQLDETAALLGAVRALADQAEVSRLLDRYITAFDLLDTQPRDDAWFRQIFTEDLRLTFPIGGHAGAAGMAEFHRAAKASWARTHHLTANHLIDLDGDQATLRAHLLVSHVHPGGPPERRLATGSHIDGTAVRTPDGWRLAALTFHLSWSEGDLPARPAASS